MKNRISNLNDHLFLTLDRLNDEDLTPEQIEVEATRADAVVKVANKIIETRKVSVDAAKLVYEATGKLPEIADGANLQARENGRLLSAPNGK